MSYSGIQDLFHHNLLELHLKSYINTFNHSRGQKYLVRGWINK